MPEPIPNNPDLSVWFEYQFHQTALFCPQGADAAVDHWKNLGYDGWIEDNAVLVGRLWNHILGRWDDVETKARMLFNYEIMPMELEFLEYDGPSRWQDAVNLTAMSDPILSHMSVYVDDVVAETMQLQEALGYGPFHRFITTAHTNPGVAGKKRFIESIFDTHYLLGYDTKLIQKVPWDFDDNEWLGRDFADPIMPGLR